jgi:hypothetical protein
MEKKASNYWLIQIKKFNKKKNNNNNRAEELFYRTHARLHFVGGEVKTYTFLFAFQQLRLFYIQRIIHKQ